MAVDMFLKIEGVDGVSSDQSTEVSSFSWGVSNAGSATAGGGGGAGKVVFQDLSITKRIDKSSPLLYLTCATGQHISRATLTLRSSGQDPTGTTPSPVPPSSMEYKLTDCIISSVKPAGSGGEELPTESVSFNFAKIEWTYKSADGSSVRAGWDVKKNTKV